MFTVAIIGRPNVGKSTLFNRLIGRKHALVDDRPGVTRDRREGVANIAGDKFIIIDTAGLEKAKSTSLEGRMVEQTKRAVMDADLCLLVIDGREGMTREDRYFGDWLRQQNRPVVMLVNKCEGNRGDQGYMEALSLGFRETFMISAEHSDGIGELYDTLLQHKARYDEAQKDQLQPLENYQLKTEDGEEKPILQLAIVGRPNTGKSTFLNKILGEDRVLVGPEAGITRDAIAIEWQYKDTPIKLIDTAGMRRRSNVTEKLEKLSVSDSLRAVQYAHVVILMIDATMPLEKQDLSIAEHIIEEGRAVVLAVNKWDMIKQKKEFLEEMQYKVERSMPMIKGVPVITLSALDGYHIHEVIDAALVAYDIWNRRFPTAKVNEWLRKAEQKHIPPLSSNKRRIRLKYMTQGNTRPPTFTLFVNYPEDLPDSYKRYLINDMRTYFDLQGVPIRLMLRKSSNPYASKSKKK